MTRLRVLYEGPRDPLVRMGVESDLLGLTEGREVDEATVTATTRAYAWRLPNRRLARLLQRRVVAAFKAAGHDVVSVSYVTVRR